MDSQKRGEAKAVPCRGAGRAAARVDRVARAAGRQNVATPAGSRVAEKITGYPKSIIHTTILDSNHHHYGDIGFIHRFNESINLKSVKFLIVFTYIAIKIILKFRS